MEFKTSTNPHLGYHVAPVKGLMNDPQGLIQINGLYHLFYQWNPDGLVHANKNWAHLVSKDLVTWKEMPVALKPDQPYDKDGCYTGCAIYENNTMYLFYTGNVKGVNNERITHQCIATSQDGINFTKHGSIIEVPNGYTGHIRDMIVWKENSNYYMILGAQTIDLKGTTLLYKSNNLLDWTQLGPFLDCEIDLGYMWECPNIVRLEENDYFIFCPQGVKSEGLEYNNIYQTGYFTGKFINEKFIVENSKLIELDRGFEFYAPQIFKDENGTLIMFAWMGTMEPEMENNMPTNKEGWAHMLSIPRIIKDNNGRIIQQPLPNLVELRGQLDTVNGNFESKLKSFEQEIIVENIMESISIKLHNEVLIQYNKATNILTVTRTNWVSKENESRSCLLENDCYKMQIFMEKTSIELFVNDGQEVFSLRYFTENDSMIKLKTVQDNVVTSIYTLITNNI